MPTRGKTQEPLRLRNTTTGESLGKASTADYSQDRFVTKTCKTSPISPPSLPPRGKNMCHISGLDLELHFLEAVCGSESGNAVTSRPVSVQILLFPARAIGTGTHTRPVNHPRPRQKRGSVHPRARRSDIAPLTRMQLDISSPTSSPSSPTSTSNAYTLLTPKASEHRLSHALSLSDSESDLHIDRAHNTISTEISRPITDGKSHIRHTQHRQAASSTLGHTTHYQLF